MFSKRLSALLGLFVLAGRVWRVVSIGRGQARVSPVAGQANAARFLRRGSRGAFWRYLPSEITERALEDG